MERIPLKFDDTKKIEKVEMNLIGGKMKKRVIFLFVLLQSIITGCWGQTKPAAAVVEDYFNALVDEDATEISNLVCKEFETEAKLELDSFIGVSASLGDLNCEITNSGDTQATVACTGKIIATYNNEQQELDVSGRAYLVRKVNSDWLVCGYQ